MSGVVQTADIDNRKYIGGTQPGYRHVDSTGYGVLIKSNLSAVVAPTPNEDAVDGYAVGSEWINTVTGTIYKCVDPTPAVSVWKDISSTSSPAGIGTELQYKNGSSFGAITGSSWDGTTLSIPNLTVTGTTTTINAVNLSVSDSLIKLANQNTADLLDIGFYGQYNSTSFTGLFRDASDGKYRLFSGLTVEPTTTVNIVGAGYTAGTLVVGTIESTTYTGLPVASAVLAGIVSTGTQTFAGEKTIVGNLLITPSSGAVVVKIQANGNSNGWIGTTSNHPFMIRVANTNYVAVDSAGLFGINRTSAIGAQLHVVQSVTTTPILLLEGIVNSSVPAIKINMGATPAGNVIDVFTSAAASIFSVNVAGAITSNSAITIGAGSAFGWTGRSFIDSAVDGNIRLAQNAGAGFGLLQLGGATSSFPAIKRNGTGIDFVLANDSGYCGIKCATVSGSIQQTKATHNNWATLGDVVNALVSTGLFDVA